MNHERVNALLGCVSDDIAENTDGKIEIHGKPYATVGLRLRCLRNRFGSYITLRSKIVKDDGESVTVKAEVLLNNDNNEQLLLADGYANKSVKYVKPFLRSSLLEFCQTSAWGRALGNLGLLGDTDVIPSAEEMILADGETIPTNDIKVKASAENVEGETDAFSG